MAKKTRSKPKRTYSCVTVKVCGVRRRLCFGPNGIKSNTKVR